MRRAHPMGQAFVGLKQPVLEQSRGQRCRIVIWHDLVVIAMHDQGGNLDLLQVLGEIRLGESLDAVVVRLGAPIIPWRHQLLMVPWLTLASGRLNP